MFRVIAGLSLLGATAVCGCAWSSAPPPPPIQQPSHSFNANKLMRAFRAQTGKRLQIDTSTPFVDSSLSLGPQDAADPRFGSFVIWLTAGPEGVKKVLSDSSKRPLTPTRKGFYWQQTSTSSPTHPSWQSTKRYGGNIYLTYFGGNPASNASLGPQWSQLNRVLKQIVSQYG
jgi:hypothetical protein